MHSSDAPSQLLFLSGALGRTQFWMPVAKLLAYSGDRKHGGWPGFGATPPDLRIKGFDDLVDMVVGRIDRPTALIAQSMGGAIAIRVALEKPEYITHLVLAATSGGVDVAALGGADWRASFHQANPQLPDWFSSYREDLSSKLPSLRIPTLLLWGDSDPISPVSVGERLASLLPRARLHVVEGGVTIWPKPMHRKSQRSSTGILHRNPAPTNSPKQSQILSDRP